MQPEAQTTTCGSLAVSMGALEMAIVIQSALEVLPLYPFLLTSVQLQNRISACVDDVAIWMQSNQLQLNTTTTEVLWSSPNSTVWYPHWH